MSSWEVRARAWRYVAGLAFAMLGLGSACSNSEKGGAQPVMPNAAVHRFELGRRFADLGEDCRDFGRNACRSNLCIHIGTPPDDAYVCTLRCAASNECPADWNCAQLLPGPQAQYCVPPTGFQPTLVAPRPPPPFAPRDGGLYLDGGTAP